jgi:hypothetical protein
MNPIHEALEPVLRDVAATSDVELAIGSDGRNDDYEACVWIATSDGDTALVRIDLGGTVAERVAAVADQVQEIVIEEQSARASNWPMCPSHRSTHPTSSRGFSYRSWVEVSCR